jgi:protein-S-isoprenylcysteine O-methyltransferase Ste14
VRVERTTACVFLGPVPHAIVYIGVPLLVSRDGRRHGWADGPRALNLVGLLPVSAGAAFIGWALATHFRAAPDDVRLGAAPDYLVREGPYRVTRNPMYLGGAVMLAGWSIFFGSVRLAAVGIIYLVGINRLAIPLEERMLHDKFGDAYGSYRAGVSRWVNLGCVRRRR